MKTSSPVFPLTGSYENDNYVWAIAMNLAWNELCEDILNGKAKFDDLKPSAEALVTQFNEQLFNKNLLEASSYLAKAGYGLETKKQIVNLLKDRFPNRTTGLIEQVSVEEGDLICFGYLQKVFKHKFPFIETEMLFDGTKVKGFRSPENMGSKSVQVVHFKDEDNFIIKLLSVDGLDEIYLVKGFTEHGVSDLLDFLKKVKGMEFSNLNTIDSLVIPNIRLQHSRRYEELMGAKLKNKEWYIRIMDELIYFSMDYLGASVENEAVLVFTRGEPESKMMMLDKPFWLFMKESEKDSPYLALRIENDQWLEPCM